MLGVGYHNHANPILFRRGYPELKGIIKRANFLFRDYGKYNKTDKIWTFKKGTHFEFGAVDHDGDETKWQGQAHDCYLFDELPYFKEHQIRFLIGWLRPDNPNNVNLRCRVIGAGNPPMDSEGRWVIRFFAPWLDKEHPKPAQPGELRYFITMNGNVDHEVDGPEPIKIYGHLLTPKSRTFIPAKVTDNPFLMKAGYLNQLAGLRESLRVRLMDGDFSAEIEDHGEQLIPNEWVLLAQKRWREKSVPRTQAMTALGVDVARGGDDNTILSPRYGNWLDKQIEYPGRETKTGKMCAEKIAKHHRHGCPVYIDAIGIGSSAYDYTLEIIPTTIPLISSEDSKGRDKTGLFGFVNKRDEWWWKFYERLDPNNPNPIALPDDEELRADLTATRFKITSKGIKMEKKEDIKKRLGRSPDKGDSCIYAFSDECGNIPKIRVI